ncbi:hypothetical protein C882_1608 [Caenispirillum salinarum AK4]|uniref:Uncharacterized protein n=1 Tax=Caenispirillum salinarum AK4 TaxID=1238182 RepID=K9H3D6_9PROT|nr:hypothetical protein [Caenispirillum salinarum]EKV32770.1 hypothetical protein C882_1608 [Caenispirillum salinarum AK4]
MADVTLRHLLTPERARAAGAAWYARLIEAAGGVPPVPDRKPRRAEGDAVARFRVRNATDTDSPDMQWYTFAHPFKPGDIKAGSYPQPRFEGGVLPLTWQLDTMCNNHGDGSCNLAAFTILLPRIKGGESLFVDFFESADGSPPAGGLIDDQPLLDDDYTVELVIDGVTWTASLNDGFTGRHREVLRDGPVLKRHLVTAAFKDPDGNAHMHLWCRFYADIYTTGERRDAEDNYLCTTAVMASPVNGNLENVRAYKEGDERFHPAILVRPTAFVLKRAGTPVWEAKERAMEDRDNDGHAETQVGYRPLTGPFDFNTNSAIYCTDDGLPIYAPYYRGMAIERPGKPVVHHEFDRGYSYETRAHPPFDTDPTLANYTTEVDPQYVAGHPGPYPKDINSAGDWPGLGFIPRWSARMLTTFTPKDINSDRVYTLTWGNFVNTQFWTRRNKVPVFSDRVSHAGLDDVDGKYTYYGWGEASMGGLASRERNGYHSANGTHNPNPGFSMTVWAGDEWFLDILRSEGLQAVANETPTDGARFRYSHDGLDRRFECCVYDSEIRAMAWGLRSLCNWWWVEPNKNPEAGYVKHMLEQNWMVIRDAIDNWLPQKESWSAWLRASGKDDGPGLMPYGFVNDSINHGYSFMGDFLANSGLMYAWRLGIADEAASDPWRFVQHFVKGVPLSSWNPAYGGHPYHLGLYRGDCRPSNTITSFGEMTITGTDTHYWTKDADKGEIIRPGTVNSPVQYAVIRWGNAKLAKLIGRQFGDADLVARASYVDALWDSYEFDSNTQPSDFAKDPRWMFASRAPEREYASSFQDHAAARLAGAREGEWIQVSDDAFGLYDSMPHFEQTVDSAENAPYWGYRAMPVPPKGSYNHFNAFAFSSGAWINARKHYVFTGGGHGDYHSSSINLFSPRTGKWLRVEDSPRWTLWKEEDLTSRGKTPPSWIINKPQYQFGASADDPTDWAAYSNYLPSTLCPRENIRGRLGPTATHTYGSLTHCYNPEVGLDIVTCQGTYPWWNTTAENNMWAIDSSGAKYHWDSSRSFPIKTVRGESVTTDGADTWFTFVPGTEMALYARRTTNMRLINVVTGEALVKVDEAVVDGNWTRMTPPCVIPSRRTAGEWDAVYFAKRSGGHLCVSERVNVVMPTGDRRIHTLKYDGTSFPDPAAFNIAGGFHWLGEHMPEGDTSLDHILVLIAPRTNDAPWFSLWMADISSPDPAQWTWADVTHAFAALGDDRPAQGDHYHRRFWFDPDYDAFFLIPARNGRVYAAKRPSMIGG